VDAIRAGVRDLNQLKALTRIGMGACGGKTCRELTLRSYREEGVDPATVVLPTLRPLVAEVPLGLLAGQDAGEGEKPGAAAGPAAWSAAGAWGSLRPCISPNVV